MWPFSRRRYDRDAEEVGPERIREAFAEYDGFHWWPLDKRYLILRESDGRDLGWKHWSDFGLAYRREISDCDDFCLVCLGDWARGFANSGLRATPAMGAVVLRCMGSTIWHMQMFGVFRERKLRFEPQTGEWRDFSTVEKVGVLIR